MKLKKFIAGVSLPLFLSSFLFSQNLVELAKKERERRAMLRGKKFAVVTNADLGKVRKRPALSISRLEAAGSTQVPADMSSARDQAEPVESGDISSPGTQQGSSVDQREPGQPSIEQLPSRSRKPSEMKLWPSRRWRRAVLGSEEGRKKGKRDRTRRSKLLTPSCEEQRILQNSPYLK